MLIRREVSRQWPEVSDFVARFCTLRESENTDMRGLHAICVQFSHVRVFSYSRNVQESVSQIIYLGARLGPLPKPPGFSGGRTVDVSGAVGEPYTRRYAFQERFALLTTRWTAALEDNRNASANARKGEHCLPSRPASASHVADDARTQKTSSLAALICATAQSTNALRLASLPGAAAVGACHDDNPWPKRSSPIKIMRTHRVRAARSIVQAPQALAPAVYCTGRHPDAAGGWARAYEGGNSAQRKGGCC